MEEGLEEVFKHQIAGEWFSPAKVNLYLAIKGVRNDGFHEIDSLVAMLDFGDSIRIQNAEKNQDSFSCNEPSIQWNEDNLVYLAVSKFRKRTGFENPLAIQLTKRIPLGSGLGGGSSNAATTFQALNELSGLKIARETLQAWALELGSDCALFFGSGIQRMRGRGEVMEPFAPKDSDDIRNQRLIVMHPGFPISAAWAYTRHRGQFSHCYPDKERIDTELDCWRTGDLSQAPKRNDLSLPVDDKYLAIPCMKVDFQRKWGKNLMMSGSGSACYSWLDPDDQVSEMTDWVRENWGEHACVITCQLMA